MIFEEKEIAKVAESGESSYSAGIYGENVELTNGQITVNQMMKFVNVINENLCSDDPESRPYMENQLHNLVWRVQQVNISAIPAAEVVAQLSFFCAGMIFSTLENKPGLNLVDVIRHSKAAEILKNP